MPIKRKQGESKDEFISRCIPIEINSGKSNEQAVAICYSYWEEKQLKAVKKIRNKNKKYAAGMPHYLADGTLWTGPTHKHNGRLMTGAIHTEDSEYLYHEDELLKFETYNDYPKAAQENAKIALRWADENGWGGCGTPVGKARANQLAKGENISEDTISRMAAFERHRQNSQKQLGDGCGRLMWLAWGGDEGIAWAQRKLEQIKNEKLTTNFLKERVWAESSNVDRMMWENYPDNENLGKIVIKFHDGSYYTYFDVTKTIWDNLVEGKAKPLTSGKNDYGEWKVGVEPSVGAAVHKYLVDKVRYEKGGNFR